MSKITTISVLPKINNFKIIKNLDVDKRYIIDPKGLNIPISVAKFTKIRELYTLKAMSDEDIKNIVLDIQLNRDGRYILHSISKVKEKFIMEILDCVRNNFTFCDFEKDVLRVYSEDYNEHMRLNQKNKHNLKKTKNRHGNKNHHGNKKRPDGYQQDYNKDYGRAAYAFKTHNDIKLILSFKEKYPDSDAFADIIANYNSKQNSHVEISKETVANINPKMQQYIRRISPLFRDITNETSFMHILHTFIKCGELKSHVDTNEVEKMKNEFSKMKEEISVMGETLALFA